MKYRVRMQHGLWYVRQYAPDGSHVTDHGPWQPASYAAAVTWADEQGWSDWDRAA